MQSLTLKTTKSQVTRHLSNHSSSGGGGSESAIETVTRRQADAVTPTTIVVGKQEEQNVLRARGLVALILLLAVAGVATAANLLVKEQERGNFESMFDGYATQIVTVSRSKANQFFDALDSFASSIGANAAAEQASSNTSWPFYRIPEWSVQAQKLAQQTGGDHSFIGISPIVQEDEIDEWDRFAAQQNPQWYQESIEQEGYTEFKAEELINNFTIPFVHFYDTENNFQPTPVTGRSEVLPYFQSYPIGFLFGNPVMFTNVDTLLASPTLEELYLITKVTRRPTLGFTRIEFEPGISSPGNQIVQPIFDGGDTAAAGRKNVAMLLIRLPWLDYFKNVLAEGENGVVVVLESACPKLDEDVGVQLLNQSLDESDRYILTYLVDGPNAVFLGEADLHNPKYDSLVVSEVFVDLEIDKSLLPDETCVPVVNVHVYPSAELEDSFQTDNNIIYTVMVVAIFGFTTLVFLLYDYSVGKRQRTVMDRVVEQDRIVSDVFPTAIRDRLYENQAKNAMIGNHIAEDDGPLGLEKSFYGTSNATGSAPLADLFPA
eukprot:scaffold6818_cov95-Cylindrotheca_fusiformis.AAC.6